MWANVQIKGSAQPKKSIFIGQQNNSELTLRVFFPFYSCIIKNVNTFMQNKINKTL